MVLPRQGQSVTVRYQDAAFDRVLQGLRTEPLAPSATVFALFGSPRPQMERAAHELAASLGRPLHRVNAGGSRFIGETEKNLHRQSAHASALGAVLLFDEADALFGKRTGVTDAHDRYAGAETNTLEEEVVRQRGTVIVLVRSEVEALRRRPGWRQVAVRFPPR